MLQPVAGTRPGSRTWWRPCKAPGASRLGPIRAIVVVTRVDVNRNIYRRRPPHGSVALDLHHLPVLPRCRRARPVARRPVPADRHRAHRTGVRAGRGGGAMSRLLQHAITAQAERRPDAIAVVMDGTSLSYAELESASNRLARRLRASGVERGDRVALLLSKSPRAIVAILATLKAGAIYVPLDPHSPAARLGPMLTRTEARCLLTELAAGPLAAALLGDRAGRDAPAVGWLDGAP